MPHHPDDPRLTAFALGELGPAENAEVEAALLADPEAAALVAEVRATALLLTEHLRAEASPGLDPSHIRAIEARLVPEPAPAPARRRWARYAIAAGLLGLAATLLYPVAHDALRPPARFELAGVPAAAPPATPALAPRPEGGLADADALPAAAAPAPPAPLMKGPAPDGMGPGNALAAMARARTALPAAKARAMPRRRIAQSGIMGGGGGMGGLGGGMGAGPRSQAGPAYPFVNGQEPGQAQQGQARMASPPAEDYSKPLAQRYPAGGVAPGPGDQPVDLAGKGGRVVGDLRMKVIAEPKLEYDRASVNRVLPAPLAVAPEVPPTPLAIAPAEENPFLTVSGDLASTFPIGCDTASYPEVRKALDRGIVPSRDSVRIEELINYFSYAHPRPRADDPFSVAVEVAGCPWQVDHRLVRVGLKAREVGRDRRPPCNLVLLVEVSGSMDDPDKLPLVQAGVRLLVEALGDDDRVALVAYPDPAGLVLDSTPAARKAEILAALDRIRTPTAAGAGAGRGIALAYEVAARHRIAGGVNRVLLATDGDLHLGLAEGPDLDRLIESRRASGIQLGVLGLGEGNAANDRLGRLARLGDGRFDFIDSPRNAGEALIDQLGGASGPVARDVRIQVRFNPDRASQFRLIGYENRPLPAPVSPAEPEDAGEATPGQSVTALYEVIPQGQGAGSLAKAKAKVEGESADGFRGPELGRVDVSCKAAGSDVIRSFRCPVEDPGRGFAAASADFRFASAVAGFGMLLRDSPYKGSLTWASLVDLTRSAIGRDLAGDRLEFLDLVRKAQGAAATR